MKPVLSRAEMRAFDRYAIDICRVPGLILMENAGRGAADAIAQMSDDATAIVVVCGAGNNGGDGWVVARHLWSRGLDVRCILAVPEERVTGDARVNFDAYVGIGAPLTRAPSEHQLEELERALTGATILVDALFGTGLARPIEGYLKHVIELINRAPGRRVALDIPSGVDADSGAELGIAVRADDTVTFGAMKLGLLAPVGARLAGRVHLVDLGVPVTIVDRVGHGAEILSSPEVSSWIAPRAANTYKHSAGSVLVVAGSRGKLGAALIVGHGALRAGAGLVTLASWPEAIDALESRVVELMTTRLDPTDVAGSIDRALVGKKVVAIGPGLGLDELAKAAVDRVVFHWDGLKVVDADALTSFAGRVDHLASARGSVILTPHAGEAARLLETSTDAIERDRVGAARALAARARATVILKGAHTIVAEGALPLLINTSGNPALATAGAGDVLAGIVAAFACNLKPREAAAAGVHIHGLAADLWREQHGGSDRGLLASEVADAVPEVLAALARRTRPLTV